MPADLDKLTEGLWLDLREGRDQMRADLAEFAARITMEAAKLCAACADERRAQANSVSGLTPAQQHAQQMLHAKESEAVRLMTKLQTVADKWRRDADR